jgi:Ca-activated chloride channel family protein
MTRAAWIALLLWTLALWGQVQADRAGKPEVENARLSGAGQIRIPNRAAEPLFKGSQGKQGVEIHFDPATGLVTIKLLVQDPSGYFIPNIRRENFVVYEDGVRQSNATVDIEHAPVSLGLLMEYGGRYQGLNRDLIVEVSRAGHQLLDELVQEDQIAIWGYGDTVNELAGFSESREKAGRLLYDLAPPTVSETNLYDALIFALKRMRPVAGRKAIILLSSGVDTFSKASYEDVLAAARDSAVPIYSISLGPVLRQASELHGTTSLLKRVDWKAVENKLVEIAKVSGGRLYSPGSTLDLSATYDDIMENLRVRYVITYKSTNQGSLNARRTVRVELVDPKSGKPLQILDANGKVIHANVVVQDSYTPNKASESTAK